MTKLALRPGYVPDFGLQTLAPTHKQLGIATMVYRLPVLAHFDQAGKPPAHHYDEVTETYAGNHLYRASVTLAKV